jgi:dephospho-CoA kinase
MKWIGLTGGIACGKSAVANCIKAKGWEVIDADQLAHMALRPGESSYDAVVKYFGRDIVNGDKSINRKALGEIVFAHPEKLSFLESVIHPWVQSQTKMYRASFQKSGREMAFYDVPLLYEKNLQDQFDAVIVVTCSEALQLSRLQARNGFSLEEAKKRIAAQLPIEEKMNKADYVIENNGSFEDLAQKIEKILDQIKK